MTRPERQPTAARQARPILRPGDTCWTMATADNCSVIVDAAGYFAAARDAMLQAREEILLVGWDFDLAIDLKGVDTPDDAPVRLGAFLKHLVRRNPGLRIRILKWDMSVLFTQSQMIPMLAFDFRAMDQIRLRFDSRHPWTAAHHQKIVVIDGCLAFCGGIDMTLDRWDTRAHLPGDRRRRRPDGEISGPWHDATTAVDGEAARALHHVCRDRWRNATGHDLEPIGQSRRIWPRGLPTQFRDTRIGIARTMPAFDYRPPVHEIEKLYLEAIRSARHSIYLESQYFASAAICEAIEARLREPDGPEIVVINPRSTVGWLEQHAVGTARDLRLASVRRADRHGRFRMYFPVNRAGEPIYVHAKILIVDDRFLRVGSSNVSNRSMGFDTECDLAIEADDDRRRRTIAGLRDDLLAEHLDLRHVQVRAALAATGSLVETVDLLRRPHGRTLRPMPVREVNPVEEAAAQSQIVNPERPDRAEKFAAHLVKSVALRVSPLAWAAVGAAGAGAYLLARRQADPDRRVRLQDPRPGRPGRD